jgi:starch-binding outer membrane protein, SusD/RagB family
MKINKYFKVIFSLFLMVLVFNCESIVQTEVFSEIPPEEILNTESGILSLLFSAYGHGQSLDGQGYRVYIFHPMLTSGLAWNVGGSIEALWSPLSNFNWNSGQAFHPGFWGGRYRAIRDANIVLANIENDNFSIEFQNQIMAEAKFIRGWSYYLLYQYFGPIPLILSTADDPFLPRSSEEEMLAFIEQEFIDAMNNLPSDRGTFGMPTKGSAMGLLTNFYLNTKQWQKSADMAQQIIDMGKYRLMNNYADVFSLDNEGNDEILWALTYTAPAQGHQINALSFPTDFPTPANNAVFAAHTYLFDSFVNSFENGDTRTNLLITEYTSTDGEFRQGLGNDRTLSLKYEWDPEASGSNAGNDIPVIRYADILLSRAEALNELNGPTQEAIDLINEVRERAEVSLLNVGDFTQESLREYILNERHWEFYFESKSRDDQIRNGVFIERAQERGLNAQPFHNRFAIPQSEIDANHNLEQNQGF